MESCSAALADYEELNDSDKSKILQLQFDILESVALGCGHIEVCESVCLLEEKLVPNSIASIMLLNEATGCLDVFVAPSVPAEGIAQLNGLRPGPGAGSCGNAVYRGEPVFVENTFLDPRWNDIRDLANNFNLCACWSMPIRAKGGRIVGSFALSSFEHRLPSPFHRKLLEIGAFIVGIVLDRQKADEQIYLAGKMFENSAEGIMITDAHNRIVSINSAFTEITGYRLNEVLGKNPSILSSGRHDREFYRDMWLDIRTQGFWQGEIWNRNRAGKEYPERLSVSVVHDSSGGISHYMGIFFDLTEKKMADEKIMRHTYFDALTGLPNRRLFNDRLEQEIKKAHRFGLSLALLFIDLDQFKEINDALGHSLGDELLIEASKRLGACVGEADTVARLGGDEFTVILGELHETGGVEAIAREIAQTLSTPFRLGDSDLYISASIGISLYPADARDAESLLKNADQALYASKNAGRNRYSYFMPSMQEAAQNRLRIATDLRRALAEGQLSLHYQPVVELATGAVRKAEALLRWRHPERGMVSPMEFIPIAEETGAIVEIGDLAFREAAAQAARWRKRFHPAFQIGINKSPAQFKNRQCVLSSWFDYMAELGLPGHALAVEITEGLLLEAEPETSQKLLALRQAGIAIFLDDFGTGYCSLSYLQKFDIDAIKIDQSFVRELTASPKNRALCRAIVLMAHELDMTVVAEGVETVDQRNLLVAMGCDYAQGYWFSKPLPAEDFERWLAEREF